MAVGLLGLAVADPAVDTLVYTVPNGISHAVVHIKICTTGGFTNESGTAFVRNALGEQATICVVETTPASSQISAYGIFSDSASMMLSPGNKIYVTGGLTISCTVSGYEVL